MRRLTRRTERRRERRLLPPRPADGPGFGPGLGPGFGPGPLLGIINLRLLLRKLVKLSPLVFRGAHYKLL